MPRNMFFPRTMAVEVKRKKGESTESLLRRFRQIVTQSGVQFRAKEVRFHDKPDSALKQKEAALRRKRVGAKRQYLQRIGKLPLDDNRKKGKSFSGRRKTSVR